MEKKGIIMDKEALALDLRIRIEIYQIRQILNKLVYEGKYDQLSGPAKTLFLAVRKMISEYCHCDNPKQCEQPCGDLWHSNKTVAPWSEQQVKRLTVRQQREGAHPYTCECGHTLLPTEDGWYCLPCNYRQNWCLSADAGPA